MRCIERLKFCGVSVSESVTALSFAPGEVGVPIGKCRRGGQSRDGQLASALFMAALFHCFRLSEMTFMAVAAMWLTLA